MHRNLMSDIMRRKKGFQIIERSEGKFRARNAFVLERSFMVFRTGTLRRGAANTKTGFKSLLLA